MSEAMQVVNDAVSGRLNSLFLPHRDRAGHHEVRGHPQRMQDAGEEAHQEEIFDEQEEEDDADAEMAEEEQRSDVEPSGPPGAAGTEDTPPLDLAGDAVSPEEDAFLLQQASQSVHPTAGSHSPRSKAGTVSGEMADLSLTSLSQPGPGEDETQQ